MVGLAPGLGPLPCSHLTVPIAKLYFCLVVIFEILPTRTIKARHINMISLTTEPIIVTEVNFANSELILLQDGKPIQNDLTLHALNY